jgi:hypothetical protein
MLAGQSWPATGQESMGGRKCVSGGALVDCVARDGCTSALAGAPLRGDRLKASGRLPQWHWQPEDLQQSCGAAGLSRGASEVCELCEESCMGQAARLADSSYITGASVGAERVAPAAADAACTLA